MTLEQQQQVSTLLQAYGLSRHGWARLERPFSFALYEDWLAAGHHGEMSYLARHALQKAEPQLVLPTARSALVIAMDYRPHPKPSSVTLTESRLALYARGDDYHVWFQDILNQVSADLKKIFPQEVFKAASDSAPILERDLAARAGLGWVGKNTCLIDTQAGSLFLIGEILTSLKPQQVGVLAPDRCGTCTRCIDICPTQALLEPRKLDARLCISYLNIEAKAPPPLALRAKIGDWMFGCDLCQTICPWNEKAFGKAEMQSEVKYQPSRLALIEELKWILETDAKVLELELKATPLLRRGAYGLKKNALIVAANQNLFELRPLIEALHNRLTTEVKKPLDEKDEWLVELCSWALAADRLTMS